MTLQPEWPEGPLPPLVPSGAQVPGSPSDEQVTAASEAVRAHCGWHIAPVVLEDRVLDSDGGQVLHLPTLRLVEVVSVQDLTGPAPVDLTGWRASTAGMLSRRPGWPEGFGAVRVVFRHGYTSVPPGLLPVLGMVAVRRVTRESLGSRSVTLDDYEAQLNHRVLDRYRMEQLP